MNDYASEYEGKNILVTGGAGCIGTNLCHALPGKKLVSDQYVFAGSQLRA